MFYKDALGVGADRATQVLAELEQKVSSMLEVRKNTVIHRDGSVSKPASETPPVSCPTPVEAPAALVEESAAPPELVTAPTLEPNPADHTPRAPACIKFAGAEFTQAPADEPGITTFVSDDAAAQSSVTALGSMGLAGKWQTVGALKVSIQNSGPPGAAVSVKFQIPDGQALESSTAGL